LEDFNNYDQFFRTFQRNNYNAGAQVQMPIFSARTKAAVGLADVNLQVAKAMLESKKNQVSADVRKENAAIARDGRRERSGATPTAIGAAECRSAAIEV